MDTIEEGTGAGEVAVETAIGRGIGDRTARRDARGTVPATGMEDGTAAENLPATVDATC